MTIRYTPTHPHLNYFLALERDFETVARFIEPCEQNQSTFSLELARLLMATTQEVDVVMKLLGNHLDSSNAANNINDYCSIIMANRPEMIYDKVELPRYGMETQPWINWTTDNPPFWWTANNKIKHQRTHHFDRATLKNSFNALGALHLTLLHLSRMQITTAYHGDTWLEIMEQHNSVLFQVAVDHLRRHA